jgi:hypothetical protein
MPAAPLDYPAHSARRREFADALTSRLIANAISYACLGGLFLVAMVLVARRTQGMLAEPLAATPLLVAGLLIAALTMLAQWQHVRRGFPIRGRNYNAADVAMFGAPVVLALLIAATITLPGSTFGGGLLLWLPIIATQIAIALLLRRRRTSVGPATVDDFLAPQATPQKLGERNPTRQTTATRPLFDETSEESLAENATQQWIRRTIDGADVLEGLARADFEPGLRATNLHIGICPPFASVPEVFAEVADDSAATVKVAEALPFGMRLEVRLPEPSDVKTSIVVAIVARG